MAKPLPLICHGREENDEQRSVGTESEPAIERANL